MISAVTCCTKSGAMGETTGARARVLVAFAIRFPDGLLYFLDCLFARQDSADSEEAGLHDRIDAIAELFFFCDCVSIDRIQLNAFSDNGLLHCLGQMIPNPFGIVRTVQ